MHHAKKTPEHAQKTAGLKAAGIYEEMLPARLQGRSGPLLVMLHWLGGSAASWSAVSRILHVRGVRCAAIDLPGFGDAAGYAGYSIAFMTDAVADTVRHLRSTIGENIPWLIAGHSMGGTVAQVLARRALKGEPGLEGLRGAILVSPSPPGPEPMAEAKRKELLESLGERNSTQDRKQAERFLDQNTGKLVLPEDVRERAITELLRMNRTAFRHWLEHGSKEDWRKEIGSLSLPALVFAGTEDKALGPEVQQAQTLPYLPQGELVTLEAAGHLAPLERPGELVEHITQFVTSLQLSSISRRDELSYDFEATLRSDRVSPRTREVLEARLQKGDWRYTPKRLDAEDYRTLRAVVGRVVPDAGFDVAALLDAQLAEQMTDGWRFAVLPSDAEAWQKGLRSLDLASQRTHGVGFVSLYPQQQDHLLTLAAKGDLGRGVLGGAHIGAAADAFPSEQMRAWFEDLRSECARHYIADPQGMDRIRYTGFADDLGFTQIRLEDQKEFASCPLQNPRTYSPS